MWRVSRVASIRMREVNKLEHFASKLVEDLNESPQIMRDLLREKRFDLSRQSNKPNITRRIQIEEYSGEIIVRLRTNGTLKKVFKLIKA